MRFDLLVQRLANKLNRWEDSGLSSRYRKRAQVKTLADLKAIGEELGGHHGAVAYQVGGAWKSLDEVGALTDAQLNQLAIVVYPPDEKPDDFNNFFMSVVLSNDRTSAAMPGMFYMAVNYSSQAPGHMVQDSLRRGKEVAESCTRVVRWWRALAAYQVVATITKATAEQRSHDRKIRWQTALITLSLSIPAAVITAVLTVLWTPKP